LRATCWLSFAFQCSVSCGIGVMHRSVQCLTNEDHLSHLCPTDLKPEERKTCHNIYNCKFANRSHLLLARRRFSLFISLLAFFRSAVIFWKRNPLLKSVNGAMYSSSSSQSPTLFWGFVFSRWATPELQGG
jgi:hypothetical protein